MFSFRRAFISMLILLMSTSPHQCDKMYILKDQDMYDEESDTPAVARTSNLNEELGQVSEI